MIRFVQILIFLASETLLAQDLTGKVVSIADGDTFTLLVDERQIRIRLHGIDCPERAQDFGSKAKEFVANLIGSKIVTVKSMDTDRYAGRLDWSRMRVKLSMKNFSKQVWPGIINTMTRIHSGRPYPSVGMA